MKYIFVVFMFATFLINMKYGWADTAQNQYLNSWYEQIRESAEQGKPGAQVILGKLYMDGDIVEQNYDQAMKWYLRAAEQKYGPAQINIADMYYNGIGVVQNYLEAARWYSKAAEKGTVSAQYSLAKMYAEGQGVSKSIEISNKWYQKVMKFYSSRAKEGFPAEQYKLGEMYLNGEGIQKDTQEAFAWFYVAAAQGYDKAIQRRDELNASLEEPQKVLARKRAREYYDKYVVPYTVKP